MALLLLPDLSPANKAGSPSSVERESDLRRCSGREASSGSGREVSVGVSISLS